MHKVPSGDFHKYREKILDFLAAFHLLDEETHKKINEVQDNVILPKILSQEKYDSARLFNKHLKDYLDATLQSPNPSVELGGPVRIYADGVFDLTHSGHYNALRQSRALGDYLVVGVVSDREATLAKGIPVYTQEERAELIGACKWVDEVVVGTPYEVTNKLIEEVKCDYVAHGDDFAPTAEGNDSYREPRAAGLMRVFKRTEGISTTDLVSRMLLLSKSTKSEDHPKTPMRLSEWIQEQQKSSNFLMTSKRLSQFINNNKAPSKNDTVIYVDGAFDVLHIGHIRLLKRAKELGTYVVVGIHDDNTIAKKKGPAFPILNLLERTLAVLALKYVDEVIIGAPYIITEYLMKNYSVARVVRGLGEQGTPIPENWKERYAVPMAKGKFEVIYTDCNMTTDVIIQRIVNNRNNLTNSVEKRQKKENAHYQNICSGIQQQVEEL